MKGAAMKCLYCEKAELIRDTEPLTDRPCWSCPKCHAEFWPEPIEEITRLRLLETGIVEPLLALAGEHSVNGYGVRIVSGVDRCYVFSGFSTVSEADTLPDALAAAMKAAEGSDSDE